MEFTGSLLFDPDVLNSSGVAVGDGLGFGVGLGLLFAFALAFVLMLVLKLKLKFVPPVFRGNSGQMKKLNPSNALRLSLGSKRR